MNAVPCQLWRPGPIDVVSRLAGLLWRPPLRYLGFQGVEECAALFAIVTHITHVAGHTGASACLLALLQRSDVVTGSSPAVIR